MAEYTPGPWYISSVSETQVFAVGERSICSAGGYATNAPGENYASENRANAHLIASAPELLEALEACKHLVIVHTGPDDNIAQTAIKLAEKALAKAKGQPHE